MNIKDIFLKFIHRFQKQKQSNTVILSKKQVLFTRSAPRVLILYFSKSLSKESFQISVQEKEKNNFQIVMNDENTSVEDIIITTVFFLHKNEKRLQIVMKYHWSKKIIFISETEKIEFTEKSIYEDKKLFRKFCREQFKKET